MRYRSGPPCGFFAGLAGILGLPSIIAAKDASAFRAGYALIYSLSGAGDHAAGLVLLLVGFAALQARDLPRVVSALSIAEGVAMILEFVALPFMAAGIIPAIVFYPWLAIVLWRSRAQS